MKNVNIILAALLILCGTTSAQDKAPLVWAEVAAKAHVRGTEVMLGDLAEVNGTDQAAVLRARSIAVSASPAPGRALLLRRETIKKLLSGKGLLASSIILKGAAEAVVTVEHVQLSGEDMLTLAMRHLSRALGRDASSAQVTRSWDPEPLLAPVGRWSTRFEVIAPESGGMGSGIVRLEVRPVVDGRIVAGRQVELAVRRKTSVLVATRDIRPRQLVNPESVQLERREIPGALDSCVTDFASLDDLVTKTRIRAGEVLRRSNFSRRPIVGRNQLVRVIYKTGALTISGEGVTLEAGAVGERIPVRVGKRRRTIHAQVLDSKTVQAGPNAVGRRN